MGRVSLRTEDEKRTTARARWRRFYQTNRLKTISLLGGVCQVCGGTDRLEFAHLDYVPGEANNVELYFGIGIAAFFRLAKEKPWRFLLLCRNCHRHPEHHLLELIELRDEIANLILERDMLLRSKQ